MKEPEDEAFEDLAKRQGDWGLQGSRKHQIMRYAENNARNEVIEEVAQNIEKCTLAFGKGYKCLRVNAIKVWMHTNQSAFLRHVNDFLCHFFIPLT